jgi:hypothetical protein
MASRVVRSRGRFRRGRSKTGGRRKGTPNRATRAWKDRMAEQVTDPGLQQALVDAIRARPELLLQGSGARLRQTPSAGRRQSGRTAVHPVA